MTGIQTLPDGRGIEFHELVSDQLRVVITNYGGRIISVFKDGADLVYGPKTPSDLAEDTLYGGAICGRVANRIANGVFSLDGNTYNLAVNNPPNHLHGGSEGFDAKIWTVREASSRHIILALNSPHGEENYPGTLEITATYTLEGPALTLRLDARVTGAATIVNLTNHVYWNLSGKGTIDDHDIQVFASAYTPKDQTGIPDGRILPVIGTPFDLLDAARLGERNSALYPEIQSGYDHNYVLPTDKTGDGIAAILQSPSTGVKLTVATNAPGLQVYSGDFLPDPRGGIALEAQDFPNAVNIAHFPCTVLRPGQLSSRVISWTIS